ncbi:hypothetical protein [Modestobacter excelsi]|uniref:hypothetical protein n=1 Tax=Modestobacter excelsi TaxID=2213161 RepID=UPI001C20E148|nr:hypothetical protein [Modestobacter excelsi]
MTSTITADHRRLRAAVRGAVLAPGDPGYAAAAQGWNLAVRQRPAIVVRAARTRRMCRQPWATHVRAGWASP